jgi:hypothetical protein
MLGRDAVQFGQNVPSLRREACIPPSTLQIHVGTTSYVISGQFPLHYVVACSRRQRTISVCFDGLRAHTRFTSQYGELCNVAASNLVDMYQRSGGACWFPREASGIMLCYSRFNREADEICSLLGCYTGVWWFRSNLSIFLGSYTLKKGRIDFPKRR